MFKKNEAKLNRLMDDSLRDNGQRRAGYEASSHEMSVMRAGGCVIFLEDRQASRGYARRGKQKPRIHRRLNSELYYRFAKTDFFGIERALTEKDFRKILQSLDDVFLQEGYDLRLKEYNIGLIDNKLGVRDNNGNRRQAVQYTLRKRYEHGKRSLVEQEEKELPPMGRGEGIDDLLSTLKKYQKEERWLLLDGKTFVDFSSEICSGRIAVRNRLNLHGNEIVDMEKRYRRERNVSAVLSGIGGTLSILGAACFFDKENPYTSQTEVVQYLYKAICSIVAWGGAGLVGYKLVNFFKIRREYLENRASNLNIKITLNPLYYWQTDVKERFNKLKGLLENRLNVTADADHEHYSNRGNYQRDQ